MEDVETLGWRKATRSSGNGAECVEVASDGRRVYARDTKRREAGHVTVTADAWLAFVGRMKAGEFDLG